MGITQNKLLTVVKSISLEHLESGLNAEEAETLWNEADLNHDGILSESEAKSLLKNLNLTIMERLRKAMADLDQHLQSDELLKEWMKECDENQDGQITKDEFLKMVMSGHAVDAIPKILLDSIHGIEEQSEKKRKRQEEDQAKEDSNNEEEEEKEANDDETDQKEEEETFESELKKEGQQQRIKKIKSSNKEKECPTTTLSKKLVKLQTGHPLYLNITLGLPFHNLKNRKFQVFIDGTLQERDNIKLLGSYACFCEPSSVISTRNSSSLAGNNSSLTDTFIDPLTRIITIQTAITPKQVDTLNGGNTLSIKLGSFGKNPGKSQIKFVTLVFEISFNGQFYNSYITMKTQRGIGVEERGCTNKESCFISDAVQNSQQDEFIQALNNAASSFRPSTIKQTPQKITTLKGVIIPEEGLVNFLEGKTDSFETTNNEMFNFGEDPIEEYPNPQIDVFSDVTCTKIHFDFEPREASQSNTLYLSFKDSSKPGLFELVQKYSQSISMYFLPQEHPEVQIALPQIVHINRIGNQVAIHHTTSPILSNFKGDLKVWVFLTINNEIIDGQIEYTFFNVEKSIQNEVVEIYTPVVTIYNIGQFAKQQYQQSKDKFQDVGDFIANFQKQFGKIIDVFGYNFVGFLKTNNFAVSGINFEEVICPEEISFRAEEETNAIVKSIRDRIPLEDEKIIENSIQTLSQKIGCNFHPEQCAEYFVMNTVSQKYLEALNPGRRHVRTDKVPYLNLKIVIYDGADLPSIAQNIPEKLKVALFFAKFVISFDEQADLILIENHERKKDFEVQTMYDCNIYTVRNSDKIDDFFTRFHEFNIAWNCSMYYDEKNCNSGHYVISVLKHLNIWEPNKDWAKLAVNVCECKPLENPTNEYPILKKLERRHTFHKQMYNFPNFFKLFEKTERSQFVEEKARDVWKKIQKESILTNQISKIKHNTIPTYRFQTATGKVHVQANGRMSLELEFKEEIPLTGEIILWSNKKEDFITLISSYYKYNFSFILDTEDQEKFLIYLGTTEDEYVLVGHIDDKLEFKNEITLVPDSWITYQSINMLLDFTIL